MGLAIPSLSQIRLHNTAGEGLVRLRNKTRRGMNQPSRGGREGRRKDQGRGAEKDVLWQPHAVGQGPAASAPSPWTGSGRKVHPPPSPLGAPGGRERSFKGWGRGRREEGLTGKRRVVDPTLTKERFPPGLSRKRRELFPRRPRGRAGPGGPASFSRLRKNLS